MPYSHSLAGAVLWSALGALTSLRGARDARDGPPDGARVLAALLVGLAVLSHYFLDVPFTRRIFPLGFDESSPKLCGSGTSSTSPSRWSSGSWWPGARSMRASRCRGPGGETPTRVGRAPRLAHESPLPSSRIAPSAAAFASKRWAATSCWPAWRSGEPAASGVTGRRYNQLNYRPKRFAASLSGCLQTPRPTPYMTAVGRTGLEPATSGV